ncbi:CAP domain-containing protein [Histomonas meleagridis]|uniref:CAP domain-containing protein n=1 Tax=Histomonas meleagridis TaxID=135588 RepID=UPI00355A34AF|nr:CAP domain-containing protein [Histomonas meleagridis]KAH0797604.1 CAP domain-containing protein [Histomonas meleagridis]
MQKRTDEEVCSMMKSQYIAQSGWTWIAPSDPNSCDLGIMNPVAVDDTERRTNFYRNLVGLPSITYNRADKQISAQRGSMAMSLNDEYGHYITCAKDLCCLEDGVKALQQSNINKGSVTPQHSIDAFIQDKGANNLEVGHRSWIFYPTLAESAVGFYDVYTTQTVIGVEYNYSVKRDYIAYPPPGPVPLRLIYPRISLSAKFGVSFPDDTTGVVTCDGSVLSTNQIYLDSEKIVLEIQDMTKIDVGTRCKVSVSFSNDQIEYEFWAINCFPNYACSCYYSNSEDWCSKECSVMTYQRSLNNFCDQIESDEINILLTRYADSPGESSLPYISPATLLKKNHLIRTEDESPLYINNINENEINDERTLTKLYHLPLGFKNVYNVNLWDLELKEIKLIGDKTPKNLTIKNNLITDTKSLKEIQSFSIAKKIIIKNCEITEVEFQNDKILINGAEVIRNNFEDIEIQPTVNKFNIIISTNSMPNVNIIKENVEVSYVLNGVNWENVENKSNLKINGVPLNEEEGETTAITTQRTTTVTSQATTTITSQATTAVTSQATTSGGEQNTGGQDADEQNTPVTESVGFIIGMIVLAVVVVAAIVAAVIVVVRKKSKKLSSDDNPEL